MPEPPPIQLTAAEAGTLARWARRGPTARLRRRARMILQAAAGLSAAASAQALGTSRACVARWRARFRANRLPGIAQEAPRSGRPPTLSPAVLREILLQSTLTRPPGAGRWSTRTLARALGVSAKTVHRVWQANGLTPLPVPPQPLPAPAADPAGLAYVVARYLSPGHCALVLGADGEGARPIRPRAAPGAAARRPRGPAGIPPRYGGLPIPVGRVIGLDVEPTGLQTWLHFLRQVARRLPPGVGVVILTDQGALHQHPAVQRCLARHPALHVTLVRPAQRLPAWLARRLQGARSLPGDPHPAPRPAPPQPPPALSRRAGALARLLRGVPLPSRTRRKLQRGGLHPAPSPAEGRGAPRTLRRLVEVRSPRLTPGRPLATWVASAEMLQIYCGDPALA